MANNSETQPMLVSSTLPDEPPPAYDLNDSNPTQPSTEDASTANIEAPPPYCRMDPSKIENLPSYSQFTPVEIIEIHGNHQNDNAGSTTSPTMAAWLVSGSNMDVGTDCTFLIAFMVAFLFNWLGFLAVMCLIPTIAARFGAMSGFGLSVVKWISVVRYHEFRAAAMINQHPMSPEHRFHYDPAQNFVFALIVFAGFFLFIRGLLSYLAVKNRARQQDETNDVFTWY